MLRRTPLRRRPWRRKPPRRLTSARNDTAFRAFVRALPCCAYGLSRCSGPIDPHHAGRRPGIALKAHDRTCIPLCRLHHQQVERLQGPFKGWDRVQRLGWYLLQIEMVQMLATPEDRESALALQGLGLGQIVERDEGRWGWAPGGSA